MMIKKTAEVNHAIRTMAGKDLSMDLRVPDPILIFNPDICSWERKYAPRGNALQLDQRPSDARRCAWTEELPQGYAAS
jgi:hypothetical protein